MPITIAVDGRQIECEPGELLIAVAERAGIYIPRFCWHPRMEPVGACRVCLCEIKGSPPIPGTTELRPQTACTSVVRDGMVVETQFTNAKIKSSQNTILELLLINHPLDCPICDRGGECPLQDQTQDYGPSESRYVEPKRRFVKPVAISPLVNLDRERCILCYRCTRFCEEISGDTMISTMERGPRAYIYPFEGDDFDSYFSGNTVQICPVGALTSTPYRFQARPWDLNPEPTTCNLCAAGCAITADVRISDGRLVRVSARVDEDVNEEWLCDKGRYGHAWVSSTDRLQEPLIRRGADLVASSWDEALGVLAERLTSVDARAALLLGGSLADEDYYTAGKLARCVLRTNNVDHRLGGGMSAEALVAPVTYEQLLGSDLVVAVSADLREELPLAYLRLRVAASAGKLRLVFVHPRRVGPDGSAQISPLPASEALVGAAIAAALGRPIAAGAEVLAAAAGVPAAELRALGDSLRRAERPVILLGSQAVGPDVVQAWREVADGTGAVLGWAPRRAGEFGALAAGAHPELLPGWRRASSESDRADVAGAWGAEIPSAPGLDASGILRAAADGDLELLWLIGADVLADAPDAKLPARALQGARFLVVQDVQRSDLLPYADLVLPAAAFAEREGTLTNFEGRRRSLRAAVDPPGAARADYAILAEVARRAGRSIGCRRLSDARSELEGFLQAPGASAASGATLRVSIPARDGSRPLRLLTYRLLYDEGSRARHTEGIRKLTLAAFVELHPDTASELRLTDGQTVAVSSDHGSITLSARVSARTRPGVAFVPYRQTGPSARELLALGDPAPAVSVEGA
jgi:NADH-quinone oxidoreductase subunit G